MNWKQTTQCNSRALFFKKAPTKKTFNHILKVLSADQKNLTKSNRRGKLETTANEMITGNTVKKWNLSLPWETTETEVEHDAEKDDSTNQRVVKIL